MNDATALEASGTVRSPQYRPLVRWVDVMGHAVVGGSRRRPIRFDALRKVAAKRIGYDDFGITAEFERASELLEKDLFDYPARFLGRYVTNDSLLRHHQNRLRVRKAVANAPPEMGLKRAPYVITGLFRTGSTLMHNLLSSLPGYGAVPAYELMCPTPDPKREADARKTASSVSFLSPELPSVHPFYWDGPEECWFLLATTLRSQDFGMVLDLPTYQSWLDELDMLESYRDYRTILEYLSAFREGGLVMKNPGHTPSIGALHRAIPEARIVFLHRDPAKSVASYCSLSAMHHRTYYGSYDPDAVGPKVLDRFSHFLQAASAQRPDISDGAILDVYYDDFVADPPAMVRRIVEHFGDTWSDEAESAVRAKLEDMPRNKHGKHVYSAAQWGLTAEGIRERFADYLRDHPLRFEDC